MRCLPFAGRMAIHAMKAKGFHSKKGRYSRIFLQAGAVGIEPTSMVLETTVLPLNYAPLAYGGSKKTAENYYSIGAGRAQAGFFEILPK